MRGFGVIDQASANQPETASEARASHGSSRLRGISISTPKMLDTSRQKMAFRRKLLSQRLLRQLFEKWMTQLLSGVSCNPINGVLCQLAERVDYIITALPVFTDSHSLWHRTRASR